MLGIAQARSPSALTRRPRALAALQHASSKTALLDRRQRASGLLAMLLGGMGAEHFLALFELTPACRWGGGAGLAEGRLRMGMLHEPLLGPPVGTRRACTARCKAIGGQGVQGGSGERPRARTLRVTRRKRGAWRARSWGQRPRLGSRKVP